MGPRIPSAPMLALVTGITVLLTTTTTLWSRGRPPFFLDEAHADPRTIVSRLMGARALELHVRLHREATWIHGHSEFTITARPSSSAVDDSGLFYEFDGHTRFTDGPTTHTYELFDGQLYYHRAQTLAAAAVEETPRVETFQRLPTLELLPPLHELLGAIALAKPLSAGIDAQGEAIACPESHRLFHVEFAGQDFILCGGGATTPADPVLLSVFGSDMDVVVRPSEPTHTGAALRLHPRHVNGVQQREPENEAERNARRMPRSRLPVKHISSMPMWSSIRRWLSDRINRHDHRLRAPEEERQLRLSAATCGCKSTPRPCIFFHGMDIPADGGLVDHFDFFGEIHEHAPCCSTIKYAVLNTVAYGWNNATLQDKACAMALSRSPTSDLTTGTIRDTILVAHSMANLMLGHAIASGRCHVGNGTDWIALSGPMRGSMGSDFQRKICDGGDVGADVIKAVSTLFGQCPQSPARAVLTYETGRYTDAALQAQYEAAQRAHAAHVTAAMCGFSYHGLLTKDYVPLALGGAILPHKSKENDGVVEFQSCVGQLPIGAFGEDYRRRFYRAKLNHADTTFHNGDGLFDDRQKPVKWFECLL